MAAVNVINYMVGYNDAKNSNVINYEDDRYNKKTFELIEHWCKQFPRSDLYTIIRKGLRDDFNNPNWSKNSTVVQNDKMDLITFLTLVDNEFKNKKFLNCTIKNLSESKLNLIKDKLHLVEKMYNLYKKHYAKEGKNLPSGIMYAIIPDIYNMKAEDLLEF